jgi:hypothetical protein
LPFWKKKRKEPDSFEPNMAPAPEFDVPTGQNASAPASKSLGHIREKCSQCGTIFEAALGVCPSCHRALTPLEIATAESVASRPHARSTLLITKQSTSTRLYITRENGKLVTKCPECSERFEIALGKCPRCGRSLPPGLAEMAGAALAEAEARKAQGSPGQPLQ